MAAYDYEEWHPVEGIPDTLHLHSLSDDLEKICIELKCEDETKPHLRLTFREPMLYRNIYKKYRLTIWEATPALEEHTLFIINNSDTLEYLHQINNNVYKDKDFVHYAIYTSHDCIDVITENEPFAEWL